MIEETKIDATIKTPVNPAVTSPEVTGQPPKETVETTQPPVETPEQPVSLEQLLKQGLEEEGVAQVPDVTLSRWEGNTKEDVVESYNQYRAYNDSEVAKLKNDLAEMKRQLGSPGRVEPVSTQPQAPGQEKPIFTVGQLAELMNTDPSADIGLVIMKMAEASAQKRADEIVAEKLKPLEAKMQLEEQELTKDYLSTFQEQGLNITEPVFNKIIGEIASANTVDKRMKLIRDIYVGKVASQHQNRKTLSDTKRTEANQAFVGGMGASGEKVVTQGGGGEKISPAKQGARQFYKDQHFSS
jgi:hypothetical protein